MWGFAILGLELDVGSKEKKMLRVKGKVAIHAIYILQQVTCGSIEVAMVLLLHLNFICLI